MKQIDVQMIEFFTNCSNGLPVPPSTANYLLNIQPSPFRLTGEFVIPQIIIVKDSDYTLAMLAFQ